MVKESSFDILRMIEEALESSPINFSFDWLRGHQDKDNDYTDLDDAARANVRADAIASDYSMGKKPIENIRNDYTETLSLTINGKKLHKGFDEKIEMAVYGESLIKYWSYKDRFQGNVNDIWWEPLWIANTKMPANKRIMITKLLSGWNANSRVMKIRKLHSDETCPVCKIEPETTYHLFQCPHPDMQNTLHTSLNQMKQQLTKQHGNNGIMIYNILFYQTNAQCWDADNPERATDMWHSQQQLGPRSMLNGIIHRQWSNHGFTAHNLSTILKEIFDIWIHLWKQRNTILKMSEDDCKIQEQTNNEFQRIAGIRLTNISTIDKERLTLSQTDFNRMQLDDRKKWIIRAKNIHDKYQRLRKKGILFFMHQKEAPTQQNEQRQNPGDNDGRTRTLQKRNQTDLRGWIQQKGTKKQKVGTTYDTPTAIQEVQQKRLNTNTILNWLNLDNHGIT